MCGKPAKERIESQVFAGIAGLSAGCYARMNGYKTTIFEAHTIPGGLCTAWTRKGYTFKTPFVTAPEEIVRAAGEMRAAA